MKFLYYTAISIVFTIVVLSHASAQSAKQRPNNELLISSPEQPNVKPKPRKRATLAPLADQFSAPNIISKESTDVDKKTRTPKTDWRNDDRYEPETDDL